MAAAYLRDFDSRSIARGRAYWREGRVEAWQKLSGGRWRASVCGSNDRPYAVMVRVQGGAADATASSRCSCPVATECKHAVALLLALDDAGELFADGAAAAAQDLGTTERRPTAARRRASVARHIAARPRQADVGAAAGARVPSAPGQPAPPGTSAVARWLQAATAALAPQQALPTRPYAARVIYELGFRSGMAAHAPGALAVTVRQARFGPDGTPRQAYDAPIHLLPDLLEDGEDAPVGRARRALDAGAQPSRSGYVARGRAWQQPLMLEGPGSWDVLRATLATGRCYDVGCGTRLRLGPPYLADLAWSVDRRGRQVLGWHLRDTAGRPVGSPTVVLGLDEPAALVADDCFSPLITAVPAALRVVVAEAPALDEHEAAAFAAALPPALRALVPPPHALTHTRRDAPPTPRLQVQVAESDGRAFLRATTSFAYGPTVLTPGAPDREICHCDGDEVVHHLRQPDAERARLRELAHVAEVEVAADGSALLTEMLTLQDAYATVDRVRAPLVAAGWEVAVPTDLALDVVDAGELDIAVEQEEGAAWFAVEMGIEVDGVRQPLLPVLMAGLRDGVTGLDAAALAANPRAHVIVPLDAERAVRLPIDRVRQIMGIVEELCQDRPRLGLGRAEDLLALQALGCHISGDAYVLDLARRLRNCRGVTEVAEPAGVRATLRPYQRQGLAWLQFLRENGLAGVLADDMGLGKTLQILAHVQAEKKAGRLTAPALVVAPTSLLPTWRDEAARFVPDLAVRVFHGAGRGSATAAATGAELLITSYGTLQRDVAALAEIHFHLVVLDESQHIKNPLAQTHRATRRLQAAHRLCLSGTPLQNHLGELWAQFAFLMPGLLDAHDDFTRRFRSPIERERDAGAQQRLATRLRPFLLRRTKQEVLDELPEKTEIVHRIALAGAQRDLYESVRSVMDRRVGEALRARGLKRSAVVVLDALLKLRQVCCDPRLVKLDAARAVRTSAKLHALMELLPPLIEAGRRILVFSQFTSMLALIGDALDGAAIPFTQLTGKTVHRGRVVADFNAGTVPVFLLSLKAGGVGLNLTAADTVVHYDPWWNPAAEDQATDRAHRMGQQRKVFVHKLVVEGSVEERMLELHARKRALATSMLGGGKLAKLLEEADIAALLAPLGAA